MDANYMAEVLGGVLVDKTQSEHPSYSIRLVSPDLGVRLRLEVSTSFDEVRLYVERTRRGGASFVGAITLRDVQSITANTHLGEVYFIGRESQLNIDRRGVFIVSAF